MSDLIPSLPLEEAASYLRSDACGWDRAIQGMIPSTGDRSFIINCGGRAIDLSEWLD